MTTDTDTENILVIEDNESVRSFIQDALDTAGFQTTAVETGKEAFSSLRDDVFDLVLLDLKLPDVDGMEILKTIRRQDEDLPVIIVSSMQEVDTKVFGFDVGCDDYITKPFHVPELIGRVRRLLRRVNTAAPAVEQPRERRTIQERIEVGRFLLDMREFRVYKDGSTVEMRKKLFDLFLNFALHPGVVITKEALHERAWDFRDSINENSLYVHIHQLRSLIEDDPSKPQFLKTVRGVGFVFEPNG